MIKRIVKNKVMKFIAFVWLLSLASGGGVQAQGSPLVIQDDATGGDCQSIGTWNASTKTCTLTTNVTEPIRINSDNLILDGNGYTNTGSGSDSGVLLTSRIGVTLRNLTIEGFYDGIQLIGSDSNTLENNTFLNNIHAGIKLRNSSSNTITENKASSTNQSGIWLWGGSNGNMVADNTTFSNGEYGIFVDNNCNNNSVTGNTTSHDNIGIRLAWNSDNNTVTNNTMSEHIQWGMDLWQGNDNNLIYNNNFIDNGYSPQIRVVGGSGNVFSLSSPSGGNYWNDYDKPAEGCNDTNSDGFCDQSYSFDGGPDLLPWTRQNGWRKPIFTPLTAFSYQGHLMDGDNPANDTYDFEFKLYDTASGNGQVGSTITKDDITVTEGLFTVALDFGSGAFTGEARWLEIGVRPGSSDGGYTTLSPRQALTPTPYALYAMGAPWSGLTGMPSGFADGIDDTGSGGDSWSLTGNNGTTPGTNFLGTTDSQPLVIKTNGAEAMRVDSTGNVGLGTAPSDDYKLYVEGKNRGIYGLATAGTNSVRPYGVVASVDTDQALTTGGGFLSDVRTSNTPNTGYVFGGKFQVNDDGNKNARGLTIILDNEESNDIGLELVVDEPGYAIRSTDTGKTYIEGDVGLGTTPSDDYKLYVEGEDRGIYGLATAGTNSVRPYGVVASVDTDQALTTGGGFLSDVRTSNTPNTGYVFGGKFEVNDDGNKNTRGLAIILHDEESNDYGLELSVDEPGYAIHSANTGRIYFAGNVGIGTSNPLDKLEVSGGNIRVTGGGFIDDGVSLDVPDYVFEEDYPLMSLDELRAYITREKHLPNVPSMKEIKKDGLNLSQFQMKLLEKTEELTLYTLVLQQELEAHEQQNVELAARLASLEAQVAKNTRPASGFIPAAWPGLGLLLVSITIIWLKRRRGSEQ